MSKSLTLSDETIVSKIYLIRGQKVMLDRDLADLYGVATRVLKQAVRRNIERFPEDFMFEMTTEELLAWREENAKGQQDKMGLRYAPFCFTEQGVTMLSCVLNSTNAIQVNIRIIRIFTKLREMLLTHKDILLKLEQIERKIEGHDDEIGLIFKALKQLVNPEHPPRRRIGFNVKDEE